jgi:uncharacterized protein involved in high-affinity Fe2+ transport
MKRRPDRKVLALLLLPWIISAGCSTGAAPTGEITVSAEDMRAGTIHVAKTYLDAIEQMPAQNRQMMVSKNPHVYEALKKAVAIDPATKSRMDSMGVRLP